MTAVLQIARPPLADKIAEAFERLAEQARRGEIIEYVAVIVRPNGEWSEWADGVEDKFRTCGMLQAVQQTLINKARGDSG